MERGREKEIGMPSSLGYNPPQPNQESSSKFSRNENRILSPTQTLDQHHLLQQHQFNVQQQQTQRSGRETNPNPDPDPAQLASAATGASNSNTPPPSAQEHPETVLIRYRECLKNHAASMGGYVVDGCGEFMPSEEGSESLKCAACECHRSFHRRGTQGEPSQLTANCYLGNNRNINSSRTTIRQTQAPSSHPIQSPHQLMNRISHHYSHNIASPMTSGPIMMAFGGAGRAPAESSSEDLNMFQSNTGAQTMAPPSFSVSKKRFRTKFTKEQKDRMHEFAERLGWKIQKQDDEEVQQFCNEMGVKRQVFKVWMHNNKQAMKKKQDQ